MKLKLFYRWYDFWLGAYYDIEAKRIYFCCFGPGFYLDFKPEEPRPSYGRAMIEWQARNPPSQEEMDRQ